MFTPYQLQGSRQDIYRPVALAYSGKLPNGHVSSWDYINATRDLSVHNPMYKNTKYYTTTLASFTTGTSV